MRRVDRWMCLFLLLALPNCRENHPAAKQQSSSVQNLNSIHSQLAAQFNADSTKARLVLLLSPT